MWNPHPQRYPSVRLLPESPSIASMPTTTHSASIALTTSLASLMAWLSVMLATSKRLSRELKQTISC